MTHLIQGDYLADRTVWFDNEILDPEPSKAVHNHSPDNFNWGYSGSAPSQLALAICLKCFPKELALELYQDFKAEFVAIQKQGEDFTFTFNPEKWYSQHHSEKH